MLRHETPTHLDAEDRVVFGLTMRQLAVLGLTLALAYAVFAQPPLPLPAAARALLALLVAAAGVGTAFLRPDGMAVEEWLMAYLSYRATPKVYRKGIAVWEGLAAPAAAGDGAGLRPPPRVPPPGPVGGPRQQEDSGPCPGEAPAELVAVAAAAEPPAAEGAPGAAAVPALAAAGGRALRGEAGQGGPLPWETALPLLPVRSALLAALGRERP